FHIAGGAVEGTGSRAVGPQPFQLGRQFPGFLLKFLLLSGQALQLFLAFFWVTDLAGLFGFLLQLVLVFSQFFQLVVHFLELFAQLIELFFAAFFKGLGDLFEGFGTALLLLAGLAELIVADVFGGGTHLARRVVGLTLPRRFLEGLGGFRVFGLTVLGEAV